MKLCKLKLKNINSFRDEIEIDFENHPLNDVSLVAITGPTGSGKTTILDAICVALYGKTPRLTGSSTRNPKNLISHGEKECSAEVHFVANETRYIAFWEGKKKGSPKGSLKNVDSNELITEKLSKKGKAMGDSESTVSDEITSILGLDFDAFTRSVMLAQGEFSAFLKASPEDRREILEATAGINIYDRLRETLNEKVNEVTDTYNEIEVKLHQIPDASTELLSEATEKLESLQSEAEKLGGKNQQILEDKESETDRTEKHNKLRTSEEQKNELECQQQKIDNLKLELERAKDANQLRPEKIAYDTAKSQYDTNVTELRKSKTELDEAQQQVDSIQADFEKKDIIYNTLLSERDKKIDIFNKALLEVNQAENQFEQANLRIDEMEEVDNQIETSTGELSKKESRQEELQTQIDEANAFLTENSLPSDRHQRLTRLSTLLLELNGHHNNLQKKIDSQTKQKSNIDTQNESIIKLAENREKLLSEMTQAEETYTNAKKTLNGLQDSGSNEYWQQQREIARNALPIAQQYEMTNQQIDDKNHDVSDLKEQLSSQNDSLSELEKELKIQTQLCKRADAKVAGLEAERELALLANPINQLREQLEDGKPCKVCGATDHPFSDEVEIEDVDLHDEINQKLQDAQEEANKTHKKNTELEKKRIQITQNISYRNDQIDELTEEIQELDDQLLNLREQWRELYESVDISSDWVEKRMKDADTAIDSLNNASKEYTDASNSKNIISQKFETCERDLNRENEQLEIAKQNLDTITDEIEDLKSDISGTENRFWESMPDPFHNTSSEEAVEQFSDTIEKVATCENNLGDYNRKLEVLSSEINSNQREINRLREDKNSLQSQIDDYQDEGNTILNAVREKTDGLETKDEINGAIQKIDEELRQKNSDKEQAENLLQESRNIHTQKQTSHNICEEQLQSTKENLNNSSTVYFDKLKEFGFNQPEEHDNAFRNDDKINEIENQIDLFNTEFQQLEVEIVALRNQFEDNPYDPELLSQLTEFAKEMASEIQGKQQKIGAQQQIIAELKENLQKREEINIELQAAKKEIDRWKRLQEVIPRNELRDFALDITFQQVSRIANEHLKYLTSERYQLKVETIGKLSVMDRWNANEERPVETLSGGESFLTSMALALALSELSQGRAQLNSLFLDEGFGTLDAETLDIAIAALEGLRMQGRSIFIISHIQELTRRLPVKINVRKRGNGSSTIDIKS